MSDPQELSPLGEWMMDEGGLSSWTLIAVLVPLLTERAIGCCGGFGLGSAPVDPSDLQRCMGALDRIPRGRERLSEVAEAFPHWKPLVDSWAELERLYREEEPTGKAPKCYALMKRLRGEA